MSGNARVKSSMRYQLLSALAAFVLWGGWAYWVNHDSSENVWLVAFTQGAASFAITLLMVQAITWLYPILVRSWHGVPLPAVCTVLATGSALVMIHRIVGTPHIAATVAPALSVGFLFCLFTSLKLYRAASKGNGVLEKHRRSNGPR